MKTAVVILNWNGRKMLEKFLPSVTRHTTGDNEVIIADNGSTDDSLDFVEKTYPSIRIIRLDKNYGFAEGYNRALAQVDADYYVLLNDDVEVTPGWIEPVVAQMEQDPSVAVCQPKLLMYDDKKRFEYAGAAGGFIDSYGYPFCRGRLFTTVELDEGQYDDPCDIFWASGAALFVKASAWRQLGGLDGDFFAHMEEIDFCWRVQNQGYKVQYCPKSTVYHVGGGTLPKSSPIKTLLNFRNNLWMLYKNLPDERLDKVIRRRIWLDRLAALKFLLTGNQGEMAAVWKAHHEFRDHREDLQRKRANLSHKGISTVYDGHILIDYYIRRHKTFGQLNINKE